MAHMVCTVGLSQAPKDRGFPPTAWSQIDWSTAERRVQSLRLRIFRAPQAPQWKQGRNLTKRLLRRYAHRLVSVRRITQVNAGRQTPGVDGVCPPTPAARAALVDELRHYQPWTASPARRVLIPKGNGKLRPLGMLTHRDRAMQRVVKNAVDPRFEAACEAQSYGCRPGRCCQEAIEDISVALHDSAVGRHQYLLDAAMHGAFDHLSQDFLLPRIGPMPGRALRRQWLKAGSWAQGTLYPSAAGAPQGGVISSRLAHIALDGLASRLGKGSRVVRSADDRAPRRREGVLMT